MLDNVAPSPALLDAQEIVWSDADKRSLRWPEEGKRFVQEPRKSASGLDSLLTWAFRAGASRISSRLPDYSNPAPGSRKPKRAAGSLFLGWALSGQELWLSAEDARQHMTIPGTTGAGKTTAIKSLLVNALAQGSGFVLVDGKADRTLFGAVLALARRFGREDDVRVLNFMVASGLKESHTFNPFATGNADAIRELLASQLGEQAQNDANGVFRERTVALIGTIVPAFVWLRDHRGVALNVDVIRFSMELRWIWKLAVQRICILRDADTGQETAIDVAGAMPEEILWPL